MMRRLPKHKGIIAGVILVIIFLIIIRFTATADRAELTQIEIIFRDLMAPLYGGVTQVSNTVVNIRNSITSYNELLEENRILREQLRVLAMQNNMLEEYRLENQRLTEFLHIQETRDHLNFVAARVIGRDPGNWFERIIIDKGTNHGIRADMAVINYQGLVGRVVATTRTTSEIMLLLDRESAVGSMIQASRAFGWVEPITAGEYLLQMIRIPLDAEIEVGDVIITAGLGGIFPRGLKIGYVAKVEMAPTGLFQQVMIIPAVEFNTLEEVMVITDAMDLPDDEELGAGEDE